MLQAIPAILAIPENGEPAPSGGGGLDTILIFMLPLLILFVVMPLFNKKEKHRRERLTQLKKHDKVVTSGGIYGTITNLDEVTATIEIAKDVRIRVKRSSVFDTEKPGEAEPPQAGARKVGAQKSSK